MKFEKMSIREMILIALLASIITVSGAIKIPSPFAGTEFQMSAPIAVVICAYFGFKRYIFAGIISSAVGLMLGTHTIINVIIAMTFRVVCGLVIMGFGPSLVPVSLAGLFGSIAARGVVTMLIGKGFWLMVISALPGMIFTMLVSWPLYNLVKRVMGKTIWSNCKYEKNI